MNSTLNFMKLRTRAYFTDDPRKADHYFSQVLIFNNYYFMFACLVGLGNQEV